ncbi:MAG: SurA N-terminal domain-containing protein [Thermoanaerobaculia bacterium]
MRKTFVCVALFVSAFPLGSAELVEKIVARVNDRLITHSEYEHRVQTAMRSPEAPADRDRLRQDVLKDLIQEKLLEERAKELDVAATDEEVENAVERIKRQYNLATDAEFDAALKASDLNRDALKRQMRQTITLQKVIGREITARLEMTDDVLRLEYERQKDALYRLPEQAQVSEIVVRFEPEDPAARERAVARIEAARAKVAAGTPFADVARESSEGNARERGGDLGTVARGELLPGLDAAVFAEPAQEYTAPALLPGSVHLFRVTDRKPAGYRPFSEVREDLSKRLSENLYDKRYEEYIQKLRREAFVKIYDPSLAKAEEKKTS